jgi:alpha-beta hydrolase superfamily lysophospholipase
MTTELDAALGRVPAVSALPSAGPTTAVALVLPGGKANSYAPTDPSTPGARRMRPFASALHRRARTSGLAVWTVRYRYRGWNGGERSPVADALWALAEVRRRHGEVPVSVLGHSMGGRTALAVGGDPSVVGVCAFAPWTEAADPVAQLAGQSVLIAHGTLDRITSAAASRAYAARASQVAARVGYVPVRGDTHAMLFRWWAWNRIAIGFTLGMLELADLPARVERALARV